MTARSGSPASAQISAREGRPRSRRAPTTGPARPATGRRTAPQSRPAPCFRTQCGCGAPITCGASSTTTAPSRTMGLCRAQERPQGDRRGQRRADPPGLARNQFAGAAARQLGREAGRRRETGRDEARDRPGQRATFVDRVAREDHAGQQQEGNAHRGRDGRDGRVEKARQAVGGFPAVVMRGMVMLLGRAGRRRNRGRRQRLASHRSRPGE